MASQLNLLKPETNNTAKQRMAYAINQNMDHYLQLFKTSLARKLSPAETLALAKAERMIGLLAHKSRQLNGLEPPPEIMRELAKHNLFTLQSRL
jgi:hypothetical protein